MTVQRRIRVYGRVQGVFFRNWTVERANALGLSGWVRNRRDGSVEILACGEEAGVQALVAACREGPPHAAVERIVSEECDEICAKGFAKIATL